MCHTSTCVAEPVSSIASIHLYYSFSHTFKFIIFPRLVSGILLKPIVKGKFVQTNESFFNKVFFQDIGIVVFSLFVCFILFYLFYFTFFLVCLFPHFLLCLLCVSLFP